MILVDQETQRSSLKERLTQVKKELINIASMLYIFVYK